MRLKEEEARDEHGREDDHEPIVRLLPPAEAEAEARDPKVVAEILADGTIRAKDPDARSWVTEDKPDWSTGHVANGRWILWWQRRQIA